MFCKLVSSTYIGYFVSTGETWASLVAQQWRTCLPMQETWSLGQEDPLEKEMATHSSISAQEIPRTEEIRGLRPWVTTSQTWLSDETTMTATLEKLKVRLWSFSVWVEALSDATSQLFRAEIMLPVPWETIFFSFKCSTFSAVLFAGRQGLTKFLFLKSVS